MNNYKLYYNYKGSQNSPCSYCYDAVSYICDTFGLPENFDGLIERKKLHNVNYVLFKVEVLEDGEEKIIEYAKTPNQIVEFLKDFSVINLPENDPRLRVNHSFEFLNHFNM